MVALEERRKRISCLAFRKFPHGPASDPPYFARRRGMPTCWLSNWMETCILGLGYLPDTLPARPLTLRTWGDDRIEVMISSVSFERRSRWHQAQSSSGVNMGECSFTCIISSRL